MNYLVFSDVHLGHRRVPTKHIATSVRRQILSKENNDLDLFFIAGDLFDRLIESNSNELLVCIELFNDILNYCNFHDIKLRILEGTPSHDNSQNRILVKLNDVRDEKDKVDLKYFESLDIEYLQEYGKHILYIPDEWTHDHDLLERQIEEKLREYSVPKVNIAILHSQFKYQVAGIPYTGFCLKEEYFLRKVSEHIHIGHYHNHSTFDRITAQGSLDRLRHNEEEDKGHVVVREGILTFIPNPNAYTFKTINVNTRTTLDRLDTLISKLPKGSYVRINMTRTHPFNLNFNEIKIRYMDYHIERKVSGDTSESGSITDIISDDQLELLDSFIIDSDISKTLSTLVRTKYELTDSELARLDEHLKVFDHVSSESVS